MDSMINVGSKITKEGMDSLAETIATIFKSGFENHMDQETIQKALELIVGAVKIGHVSISNCTLENFPKEGNTL